MKIGIIGAENSHAGNIALTINVLKKVPGFSVDYIWGETAEFAKAAAEKGKIPHIVKKPEEMLGKVDGIMVDHRHGKYHLAAARPFVEAGVPAFIDKPFCYDPEEGREFLEMARKKGVAVTSFSTIAIHTVFRNFVKKLREAGRIGAGWISGPVDLKSPYGGVFFYGIHQVEVAMEAFGTNVDRVMFAGKGDSATAQLIYREGHIVTLHLLNGLPYGFAVGAFTEKGVLSKKLKGDKLPYLKGARIFCKMFRTGEEPLTHERILKPILILDAIERSRKSGRMEKVAR